MIRVILENGLGFPGIAYSTYLRRTRGSKKVPKTVLKTKLKTKETTHTSAFRKYFVVFSGAIQIGHFQFQEDSF
jgi:hypothetical protein